MSNRGAATMLAAGATAAVRFGPFGIAGGLCIILAALGWLTIKYTGLAIYWVIRLFLYEGPRWIALGIRWARYDAPIWTDRVIRWARRVEALLRQRAAR